MTNHRRRRSASKPTITVAVSDTTTAYGRVVPHNAQSLINDAIDKIAAAFACDCGCVCITIK